MALISLAEYKQFLGIQAGNTLNDAQINALLDTASSLVASYSGRDFSESSYESETRNFLYDGSGFLDIDDCSEVTQVDIVIPNSTNYTLTSDEYTAMPDGGPVRYYLVLHGGISAYGISPEMGFTWNLDQHPGAYGSAKQPVIGVTAVWGWEEIPADVKFATALVVQGFVETSGGAEGLTSEAIEGWSRAWGTRSAGGVWQAIPDRARDILASYSRFDI